MSWADSFLQATGGGSSIHPDSERRRFNLASSCKHAVGRQDPRGSVRTQK
ncbi:MAG: hypothetical protein GTN37_01920 [Candidatus Aenigmarchaeota archaeon]|nr:hypothetical protein [Candidatus Aenigmarchaeota archaeon]